MKLKHDRVHKEKVSKAYVKKELLELEREKNKENQKVLRFMAGYLSGSAGFTDKHPEQVLEEFRAQALKELGEE